MAGAFEHLHLKKNTAGSSNELSLDVLDAARTDLDDKSPLAKKGISLPKPLQSSFEGVKSAGALASNSESKTAAVKEKVLQSKKPLIAIAVVAAAVAVALFAVGQVVPQYVHETKEFDSEFNEIVSKLVELDSFMAKVDDVMEDPLADDNKSSYSEILSQLDQSQAAITEVRNDVSKSSAVPHSGSRRLALEQLDSAAEARSSMLTAAGGVIRLSQEVDSEVERANQAWMNVIDADQLARQASHLANSATTEEETRQAREQTQQALDMLNASLDELQGIADRHRGIDLASQISYLRMRIEAIDHAVATSDALLAMDREKAQTENEAYNEADARAAAMAESLPTSVEDAVRASYAQEIEIYEAKYASSREQAISADAAVRNYLADSAAQATE